jgi:hypothetical protein
VLLDYALGGQRQQGSRPLRLPGGLEVPLQ